MARIVNVASQIHEVTETRKTNVEQEMTIKTKILAVLLLSLMTNMFVNAQSRRDEKTIAEIRAVLDSQRDAWNRGDIDGYMQGYDRSDATVFVSGDSVNHGWQTVLDRYKRNYSTREKMGKLTFSDLETKLLNSKTAVVIGRWHLQRANDEPHGRFTLIFRRTKNGWKIIHDHTSSA